MPNVLSIDPAGVGGDTGIALGYYDHSTPYTLTYSEHVSGGVQGVHKWFKSHMNGKIFYTPDLCVNVDKVLLEDFEEFGIMGADHYPLRILGALEVLFTEIPVIFRSPIARKFVTDDMMKNLGAYVAGGHHRDVTEAARHAVAWVIQTERHVPTIKAGNPNVEHF